MNEVQYCKKCGNKLNSGDVFCNKCGTKIISKNNMKNKKVIITMVCVLSIIVIIVFLIINRNSANFSNFISSNNYEEEIEKIKPLLIDRINSVNSEQYETANKTLSHYIDLYKKPFRLDTSEYKTNNLTEGILNAEFNENYKNRNIYYFTTKGKNGFAFITNIKYGTREGVITIKSSTYDGLYVYIENEEVYYNIDIKKLKEGIDKKEGIEVISNYDAYKNVLNSLYQNVSKYYTKEIPGEYFLEDINNDDIPELVVIAEKEDGNYATYFYTFINYETIKIGEINPSNNISFYKMNNENYLKEIIINMNNQESASIEINHIYYNNGKFEIKKISSKPITMSEIMNEEYEKGDEFALGYALQDLSGLEILK